MSHNSAGLDEQDPQMLVLWRERLELLSPTERRLLLALALRNEPISFDELAYAAYNPFQIPPPPPPADLPPLPQIRPNPWSPGASEPPDPPPAERAAWRERLQQARAARRWTFGQAVQAQRRSERFAERLRLLSQMLFSLSDQGLIEAAGAEAVYSVHPLVRLRALGAAEAHPEYRKVLAELRQELAISPLGLPPANPRMVTDKAELAPAISRVRTLSAIGSYHEAIREYRYFLSLALFNLGEWQLMADLLDPIARGYSAAAGAEPELVGFLHTELANASGTLHNYRRALDLYEQALEPDYGKNPADWASAMSNFGLGLVENGQLARAGLAYEKAVEWGDEYTRPWVRLRQVWLATLLGDGAAAEAAYLACKDAQLSSQSQPVWRARLALARARVAILNGASDAEQLLQEAARLSEAPGAFSAAKVYGHLAWHDLVRGRLAEAEAAVCKAIATADRDGASHMALLSLRARIMAAQGDTTAARELLATALRNHSQGDHAARAEILTTAAALHHGWGDQERAGELARRALELAWPAGEPAPIAQPYRELEQLRQHLEIDWRPSAAVEPEPLPHVEEIDRRVKQARTLSNRGAQPQPAFPICAFEWVQLGTIACFGIEPADLIEGVSAKLAQLSWEPTPLTLSKMGEPVPDPPRGGPDPGGWRREFDELRFSNAEQVIFDKIFVILGIVGRNEADELVFAFVNCRVDRLGELLRAGDGIEPFDLADYCTLVEKGAGLPHPRARKKLREDYVFGEQASNVRIFPPLSAVT